MKPADGQPHQQEPLGKGPWLDVGDWAYPVEGLGPGRRLILWVRGCPLACPGCMTPEMWEPGPAAELRDPRELALQLAPLLAGLDGLTISGGEPMLQAAPLSVLLDTLRSQSGSGELEVLCYSGFTLEEMAERGSEVQALLARLDLLIDGRFEQAADNTRAWRGSDNQRVHLLSHRAQKYAAQADASMPEQRQLQLQMLGGGSFRIIGIPRRGDLAAYRAAMAARGIAVRPDIPAKKGDDKCLT